VSRFAIVLVMLILFPALIHFQSIEQESALKFEPISHSIWDDYDSHMYYRHTNPNSATIEIADKLIDENEILLLNYWEPYVYLNNTINWSANPYQDITWDYYFHSLWMINYLIDAYTLSNQEKYLIEAMEIIISWNDANPNQENQSSPSAWKDHSTANRLTMYVHFWDNYRESNVTNIEFTNQFMDIIQSHANFTAKPGNYAWWNNHGLFQSQALLQIGYFFPEIENSSDWLELSKSRITTRLLTNVTESGIFKEHSTAYHYLAVKLFIAIEEFCNYYNFEIQKLSSTIHKMQEYMGYVAKLDGTVPMIGDSSAVQFLQLPEDSVTNDFLLYRMTNGEQGVMPKNNSIVYHDAGVAIFKNDWGKETPLYLNFVNRYHSVAHKHSDDLSFVLSYGETDFLVDSGKYNYVEENPYRKYIRSTLAHNTITVDNVSYPINNSNDFGNPIVKNYYVSNDFSFIEASHSLYDGVEITRTLLFFSEGAIYIHDQIDSMEPHHYTQVFNIGSDVAVQENGNLGANLTSNLDGKKIFLKQLQSVEESSGYIGSSEPISGWQSTSLNQLNPIHSLHYSKYGNSEQFQTAINIETSIVSSNWSNINGNVIILLEFDNGTKREIILYDLDNDGIPNSADLCHGHDDLIDIDQDGTPDGCDLIIDFDGDGIDYREDSCPNTLSGSMVNENGCARSQLDTDSDGITDNFDYCPETPLNLQVFENGCAWEELDDDIDGVANDNDAFPDDANETMDSDGDGIGDNGDAFLDDANETMDSDGDGIGDNEQLEAEEKKAQQKLFIIIVFLLAIIFYWRRMK